MQYVTPYSKWREQLNGQGLWNRVFADKFNDGYTVPKWERVPRAQFDESYLRGQGTRSLQYNDNWNLPNTDTGGISFRVRNPPEQLMIDLGGYRSDFLYYTIVIGRGNMATIYKKNIQGTILAGWTHMPNYTYTPLANVRVDPNFHFDGNVFDMWMTYNYGQIRVGLGPSPDSGRVVLEGTDPQAAPGVQLVAFGSWDNPDDRTSTISHVYPWRSNTVARH